MFTNALETRFYTKNFIQNLNEYLGMYLKDFD